MGQSILDELLSSRNINKSQYQKLVLSRSDATTGQTFNVAQLTLQGGARGGLPLRTQYFSVEQYNGKRSN